MPELKKVPDTSEPHALNEIVRKLNEAGTGAHDHYIVPDSDDGILMYDSVEIWACGDSDKDIREAAWEAGYVLEPQEILVNIRYRVYERED